jgi:outer membrane protein insertion porin family
MQRTRAHGAALASGLALLLGTTAITLPSLAFAQAAEQSGVVQRIIVEGNERIEQSTVLSYLPIQPGETADPAKLDLALKALFRTDLFSDV